jgi:hypothetical protein
MKNPRGNKEVTYSRMKAKEDKAQKEWLGKTPATSARSPTAEQSQAYKTYSAAAKKRAQAGAAMVNEKKTKGRGR